MLSQLIEQIFELLDDLPECAEDFAASVDETTRSIHQYIEDRGRVSDKQLEALENMVYGARRWGKRE